MNFLSPWMLLGLIGAAIPIAVHLQGRRKAKTVRFAALDYLLGTDKRLAKKLVLRQIALLVARVLICLIIPLILSKPYASCAKQGPLVATGPQAAVLLIDNSITSGYTIDGQSLLQRSLASARDILLQLGHEADVAIVTTTTSKSDELSRDHLVLAEGLSKIEGSYKTSNMSDAIARSSQLLAGSGHAKKTIFVLAAPTRQAFPNSLTSPGGPNIRVVSPVGDGREQLGNVAITDLQVRGDVNIGDRGVSITPQVKNFGAKPKTVRLALKIGGKVVAQGELSLKAGESKKKRFSANLGETMRRAEISVSLEEDALVADNERFVVVDSREQVPVLLVNGDPRTIRHEDELYYLEAALRPGDRSDSGTSLVLSTPDTLKEVDLDAFDVILLANVEPLDRDDVKRLGQWVQAGGGLWISLGDKVSPTEYNKRMKALLAQELHTTIDLRSGRKSDSGKALRLSKIETDHPIFSLFKKDAPGLYDASFDEVMLLGTSSDARDRKVLARYTNGAAALIETKKGKGHLLLFTSTLDRDWNNLAIHPGYLPFVQSSIRYLAAKPFQRGNRNVTVGNSVSIKLSPGDTKLEVSGPEDSRLVLEGDKVRDRIHARIDGIVLPGFYNIQSSDKEGKMHARPQSSFVVNVDTLGSDLRLLPPESLEIQNASPGSTEKTSTFRRIELWHSVAAGLLFFLLLESMLSLYGSRTTRKSSE